MTVFRALILVTAIAIALIVANIGRNAVAHSGVAAHHDGDDAPAAEAGGEPSADPICQVRVQALARRALDRQIQVIGTVEASARARRTVSAPYDIVVGRVTASVGEVVSADAPVVEGALAPDAVSARAEAFAARDAAKIALAQAKQRVALHLATAQEVQQAQQALELAEPKAAMWEGRAASGAIAAGIPGIITKITVQQGQMAPAGTPLVEVSGDEREIRFGFEPAEAARIIAGQPIRLGVPRRPDLGEIAATIAAMSPTIATDTRLQEALVRLQGSPIPVGEVVKGTCAVALPEAWVVPRDALVLSEDAIVIFTVVDGKAVSHRVTVVGSAGHESAISADGLTVGDAVVVVGGQALEAGMRVQVQATP